MLVKPSWEVFSTDAALILIARARGQVCLPATIQLPLDALSAARQEGSRSPPIACSMNRGGTTAISFLALCASVTSSSSGVVESPAATRTLLVGSFEKRRKRSRLRNGHNCLERQRGAMGVATIRDTAYRVAQDLDRRLRDMLVVVRRTCLTEIFKFPRFFHSRLDIRSWLDSGKGAKLLKASIRASSSP